MYNIEMQIHKLETHSLIEGYRDEKNVLALCQSCDNYGKAWSCPPFDFDVEAYCKAYLYIYIIGMKIAPDPASVASVYGKDSVAEFMERTLREARDLMEPCLLRLERMYPDSVAVFAGSCHRCKACARLYPKPCVAPEKMRYSLEALGFDVTQIAKEVLDIQLLWPGETMPAYYTLVQGFLTNAVIDNMKVDLLSAAARRRK